MNSGSEKEVARPKWKADMLKRMKETPPRMRVCMIIMALMIAMLSVLAITDPLNFIIASIAATIHVGAEGVLG